VVDEYVRRTAITRLLIDDEQRELLEETLSEWKRGRQLATDMAWGKCNAESDVQPFAYADVREHTNLGSQHAILATHQAAQAITSCLERRSKGKTVSKSSFTAPTVAYDSRSMTVFDDDTVSLSTTESRVRCDLALPDADDGYQHQYLDPDTWSVTESTLTARDSVDSHPRQNGCVVGAQVGVPNAVRASGGFTTHPEGFDAEFTDKPHHEKSQTSG
jgi:hypothetical protein